MKNPSLCTRPSGKTSSSSARPPEWPPEDDMWLALLLWLTSVVEGVLKWLSKTPAVNRWLSAAAFRPAPEYRCTATKPLRVLEGAVPEALRGGVFLRNGPNFIGRSADEMRMHWFDGHGMVHAIHIRDDDGSVHYTNHQIRNRRYELAMEGKPAVTIGASAGRLGLVQLAWTAVVRALMLEPLQPLLENTNNTALLYHNRRLLALSEEGLPIELRLRAGPNHLSLETVGTFDPSGRHKWPFTAHPHVDEETGELFFFGYSLQAPHVHYTCVDKHGELVSEVALTSVKRVTLMHDFAVMDRFALFPDLPLVFDPAAQLTHGTELFRFDPNAYARIGVLPKYATEDTTVWFDLSRALYFYHIVNVYEDGDEIVLVACVARRATLSVADIMRNQTKDAEVDSSLQSHLWEFRLNLTTRTVSERQLSNHFVEFPAVARRGRRAQFAYLGLFDDEYVSTCVGVMKYDLQANKPVREPIVWGPQRTAGECVFEPREGKEDDGWLLTTLYDKDEDRSEFVVVDAATMDIVARVELPQRVPAGFHGLFVRDKR